jgi:hypothetical protein
LEQGEQKGGAHAAHGFLSGGLGLDRGRTFALVDQQTAVCSRAAAHRRWQSERSSPW